MDDLLGPAVIAALITSSVALLSVIISFHTARKELLNSLDSKSGWRKEIYNIASKSSITEIDLFRLRSSLRFSPKNTDIRETYKGIDDHIKLLRDVHDFDGVSDILIVFCEKLLEHYSINGKISNKHKNQIRIYCMYLLKDQWENLLSNWYKRWYWKIFEEESVIKEMYEELKRVV